jgi:predicted nucleic acid-binding protein
VASRLGLRFIGILGVLVEAKQRGYLSAVKPVVDDLRHKAGFWISAELRQAVLHAAGET